MLLVIVLNVIMMIVIMLSVMAPLNTEGLAIRLKELRRSLSEQCLGLPYGATTLGIMTFSTMTHRIIKNKMCHSAQWHCSYADNRLC
jgi:hypothetical protein